MHWKGDKMDNLQNKDMSQAKIVPAGIAYKFLRLFTVIHPGESGTALLLMLNVFLLLAAYYIIKPVRSALILAGKGAEWESYLNAVIAVLLIFVVKAFSSMASHLPRQKLISWVTAFFISNLVVFYFLSFSGISLGTMGIVFFLWVGIFNVMVVAQFWGFANDLYSEEMGKRLFPIVAFGAASGGFTGSRVAGWLIRPIGLYQMMLVSGAMLGLCIILTLVIHRREVRIRQARVSEEEDSWTEMAGIMDAKEQEKPLEKGGGFQLLFKKRYLFYIAFFVLLLNFVNTNGQYMLHSIFEKAAVEAVDLGTAGGLDIEEYIGAYEAKFMMYFNLLGMIVQLFVVSRVFKWFGVRVALFILPFIAIGGYFLIAVGASLMLTFWVKVAENGTDYSLMNTTRHALFLITAREEKYKAKAAIDTFFHRAGDVLSALIVFLGTTYLAFNTERFGAFNVGLVIIWLIIGVLIFREHKRLSVLK
jgi:AAA family ATP:ADP antiporter